MRRPNRHLFVGLIAAAVASYGCAEVPPCTVSPVEIEETREDSQILDKDLTDARKRAKSLSEELARKQAEYNSKKDKPKELRKKLDDLKKGSGRGEKKKKEKKKKDEKEAT